MSSFTRNIEKRIMKSTGYDKGSKPYPHPSEFAAALAKQKEEEG